MPISTISSCFNQLRERKGTALMPFIMAGDPNLSISAEILIKLQESGADIIELGIPYSDPLADGPVIQAAASRALKAGTTPKSVLKMLSSLKGKLTVPILLFTYSNPLLNRGMQRFCKEASDSGAAGLVVPDLPLEEAEVLSPLAASQGLDLVLLIAPTTPAERLARIAQSSRGFTYLVSVTGVTGERSVLDQRVKSLIKQVKEISSIPVAVGFGISGPDQVTEVRTLGADGAIIGSALVKRIFNAAPGCEVDEAGIFCSELRKAAG